MSTTERLIKNGQVVFQFCFDLGWETRISETVRNIAKFTGWTLHEELIKTTSEKEEEPIVRLIFNIGSAKLRPFADFEIEGYSDISFVLIELDDSGALAIQVALNFENINLSKLVKDSETFHENETILKNAKRIAKYVQDQIRPFINKASHNLEGAKLYEDYVIYRFLEGFDVEAIEQFKIELASLIDDKKEVLSDSEDSEANEEYADELLGTRLTHPRRGGVTIVSYHGAICIGKAWDVIIEMIRIANMELLELKLIRKHLVSENAEFDKLCTSWGYRWHLKNWFTGRLLSRIIKTRKDVDDQLERIETPIIRFNSSTRSAIYDTLKGIFRFEPHLKAIEKIGSQIKDTESIIADRKSSWYDKVFAVLGVLVAFEYFTSSVKGICAAIKAFIIGN